MVLRDGEEVVVFEIKKSAPPGREDITDKVKTISGDISDWAQVLDVLKANTIESIYHASALLVRDCEDCPAAAYRVNVTGGFNILEAARILGISDAATKACCEHLGNYYHRKYDLNFRGIRFPMVIGPGREISYYYGDYSGAVEMPARGKPYTIHVDASNPSALIYVKDVARALIALKKADPGKLRQRMYNVHGFTATMSEVAEAVKRVLPEAQIEFNWDQSDEMQLANSAVYYELDNTAAREDFGWQPQYPLDKKSQDFINEIKAQLDLQ